MRKGWVAGVIAAAGLTLGGAVLVADWSPPVTAQQAGDGFTFAFATANKGTRGRVGSSHTIGTGVVPAHLQGADCTFVVNETNNPSENQTDLIVGGVRFSNVEANGQETYTGSLTLGEVVVVRVVLGPRLRPPLRQDPVSSIQGTVSVSCPPPPTTTVPSTTTPSTTSPTTTPSTSPAPSTSTTVPPVTVTTAPPVTVTTSPPPASSTGSHRCPPGSYSIGNGACAAVEESG